MSEHDEALDGVLALAATFMDGLTDYLDRWPSSRISHRVGALTDLMSTVRRERSVYEAEQERAAVKAEPKPTEHEAMLLATGRKNGWLPPDATLVDLNAYLAGRQADVARISKKGTVAQQLATTSKRADG